VSRRGILRNHPPCSLSRRNNGPLAGTRGLAEKARTAQPAPGPGTVIESYLVLNFGKKQLSPKKPYDRSLSSLIRSQHEAYPDFCALAPVPSHPS
jgi:hypothetical protein